MLGDIVISKEKVLSQAEEFGHSALREYAFLIVHSVLHLIGYDHMQDEERQIMERKQKEIYGKIKYITIRWSSVWLNNVEEEKNFLVQGSILAIAGVITKIIGAVYRIPLTNIAGAEGIGYYSVAFSIYSVALMLTSYSLPLAVSKLVSARVAVGEYRNAYKVFKGR